MRVYTDLKSEHYNPTFAENHKRILEQLYEALIKLNLIIPTETPLNEDTDVVVLLNQGHHAALKTGVYRLNDTHIEASVSIMLAKDLMHLSPVTTEELEMMLKELERTVANWVTYLLNSIDEYDATSSRSDDDASTKVQPTNLNLSDVLSRLNDEYKKYCDRIKQMQEHYTQMLQEIHAKQQEEAYHHYSAARAPVYHYR